MPALSSLNNAFASRPALVLGTGPSAWNIGTSPEFLELVPGLLVIGINRAYEIHRDIRLNFQISTDKIWDAFLKTPDARSNFDYLTQQFRVWRSVHAVKGWSLEDFITAYKSQLEIHPEVWRYFRLASPFAPFVRLSYANNSTHSPYREQSILFRRHDANRYPIHYGRCLYDSLIVEGNTAQSAIHLAAVMGCAPIFVLGVDLTPPEPDKRPWEKGAVYRIDGTTAKSGTRAAGFRRLAKDLRGKVHVVNLNPKTMLRDFEVVESIKAGLQHVKEVIKRADQQRSRRAGP